MIIFPAVDILGGRCVQLVQGKRETATGYGDPLACACRWRDHGADHLHVVNLDGAFGRAGENTVHIREIIRETGMGIELGGGIRTIEDAAGWLGLGVDRVILGTAAFRDPEILSRLADTFGKERIMAGVDAKAGRIAIEGWEKTGGDYLSWALRFEAEGAGSLLFTNVDVEGLQGGLCIDPAARLIGSVRIPVVVAGGVTTPEDIRALKRVGAYGVVLGSSLYAGKITLREALEAAK
jgi:phosphoribosylformimino-5-aminoimidazole carboxamide ribotide isomerase